MALLTDVVPFRSLEEQSTLLVTCWAKWNQWGRLVLLQESARGPLSWFIGSIMRTKRNWLNRSGLTMAGQNSNAFHSTPTSKLFSFSFIFTTVFCTNSLHARSAFWDILLHFFALITHVLVVSGHSIHLHLHENDWIFKRWKINRNNSSNYRRPFPPLPPPAPPRLLPPLDNERPNATPPRPLLAKLTAFRTFKSLSSAFGFLVFLLSLSIFARRFNDVLFSFSMDASVGSNYLQKKYWC